MPLSNRSERSNTAAPRFPYIGPGHSAARPQPTPKIEAPTKTRHSKGWFGLSGCASSSPKKERFSCKPLSWYSDSLSFQDFQPFIYANVGIEKANATKRNTIKLGSNVFLVTERNADTVAGSSIRPTQSDNPNKDPETEFATDFVHLRSLSFSPYTPMSVTTAKNAKLESQTRRSFDV